LPSPFIPPQLDGYELLDEIGKGGMGTVYRGVDRRSGDRVAIKHLRADIADSETVARFQREGEVLRRLNHPNIVQLRATVQSHGQHYLIMELVESGSLRQKLDRARGLDVREALSLSIEIADALTRAHHLGVIHRDIKPANVLLAADGTPRLADFGIARTADAGLTAAGMVVGTLAYLAPEVLRGKSADPRSDVWSFGVVLFEMMTGVPPFDGARDVAALIQSILNDPVPDLESLRPGLPAALIDLIYRMLTKEPAERIPSFRLVGAELESIREGRESGYFPHGARSARRDSTAAAGLVHLPAQTTAFVGRAAEMAEVKRVLAVSRLVTILAQGGMGKTRLGLEVARQLAGRFADGRRLRAIGSHRIRPVSRSNDRRRTAPLPLFPGRPESSGDRCCSGQRDAPRARQLRARPRRAQPDTGALGVRSRADDPHDLA
jgi:hypothetical protein